MREEQFAALRDATAEGGVDFEGLVVERDAEGGYRFESPLVSASDLSAAELRAVADGSDYATNWYHWERAVGGHGTHRRRFLRMLERADERPVGSRYDALGEGVRTEWGQLLVTVELGADGERIYEVRHVDDAGVDAAELTRHTDPQDARDVGTHDEKGRYRPLRTAPSLPAGWLFAGLDGRDAVRTVEAFYPATVANWSLEAAGELDVSHWRETAERQTGIYDVLDEMPREGVEWMHGIKARTGAPRARPRTRGARSPGARGRRRPGRDWSC